MRHHEGKLQGAEQQSIYFQYWMPESRPKAILLLVHGAGEHSGRYLHLAQLATGHGIGVAALDHNGHGQSDGTPGHVHAFDDYLDDLDLFHDETTRLFDGVPMFLLGHSLGGLISCKYLLQRQNDFVGCILSGALIKTNLKPGRVQMAAIHLLARLTPRLGVKQLDARGVSRDPEQVKRYVEDPLVFHGKASARMVRELFVGMAVVQAHLAAITVPMLILHGGSDVMTSPDGSRDLYQHIKSKDKTLLIYPSLYHEIFNEPEGSEIMVNIFRWCEARLPAG